MHKSNIFITNISYISLKKYKQQNFSNFKNVHVFKVFFHKSSWNFLPAGNIDQIFFAWLIREAVGQIDFPLEVFFNLKPPLTTFLNSPRNSCEYLYEFFKLKMVPNWILRCQEEDDPRKNLKQYCYTVSLSLFYTHCLGIVVLHAMVPLFYGVSLCF